MAVLNMTFEDVSLLLSVSVLAAATLALPYMAAALLWRRKHPRIRNTYNGERAFYHPSLWFLTWLTRVDFGCMLFVLAILLLRLALRYEVLGEATPQPFWSLSLSALASLVLVLALSLPATFLFTVKRWIIADEDIDERGHTTATNNVRYEGKG